MDEEEGGLHEMFVDFVKYGFSEMQALRLIALIVVYMKEADPGMPEIKS